MKTKYTTSKTVGAFFLVVGISGLLIAVWDSPSGFRVDSIVLILIAVAVFIFFDLLWGISVSLSESTLSRVDSFIFRKEIPLNEIEVIRYQPTYGIGKEVSSLYVFRRDQNTAVITMTSVWFTERALRDFLRDIKKLNPAINLDEEAQALMQKTDDYFDAQKIRIVPFAIGAIGVIAGIILFVKAQSSIATEFSILNNGLASISAGMIAGFGTYTLLRRVSMSLIVGILAAVLLLGIYWMSSN